MGESFEVGEFLVADNEPDAVLVVGDVLLMALYVGVSVVIGILAAWGGMALSNISIKG